MEIQHALVVARADATRIAHFIERRDRFLDALDWSMLTEDDARQAAMLDDLLENDMADALLYIDWLVERLAVAACHPNPVYSQSSHVAAHAQ